MDLVCVLLLLPEAVLTGQADRQTKAMGTLLELLGCEMCPKVQ